jgi:tryptophan synthase alpha chain
MGGFTVNAAFKKAKEYSKKFPQTEFIFVLYANTINNFGIEKFCAASKNSGISGLIIPDLPFDSIEGNDVTIECKKNNLNFIPVVSPNTPELRLQKLWQELQPKLVYATAIAGITGTNVEKKSQNLFLQNYVDLLRKFSPGSIIAVGFGIKTLADVKNMAQFADVVVVGSAIVSKITETYKKPRVLKKELSAIVGGFSKQLQQK